MNEENEISEEEREEREAAIHRAWLQHHEWADEFKDGEANQDRRNEAYLHAMNTHPTNLELAEALANPELPFDATDEECETWISRRNIVEVLQRGRARRQSQHENPS